MKIIATSLLTIISLLAITVYGQNNPTKKNLPKPIQTIKNKDDGYPATNPKYYTDNSGKLFWNRKLPIYLWVSTTKDHAEKRLDNSPNQSLSIPFYLDTEGLNFIRSRNAVDPVTHELAEPLQEVKLEIYGDGLPPSTDLETTAPNKYVSQDGKVYYGVDFSCKVLATDKTSGVESIKYSVNGADYNDYTQDIKFDQDGGYIIKYFAIDNVGNVSPLKDFIFTLDETPPITHLNINGVDGPDSTIAPTSKIYLTKTDNITGVNHTYYAFDDEPYRLYEGEDIYFNSLTEGRHTIRFYSEDKVGNREAENIGHFFYDKSAPLMAADILGDRFLANGNLYFSGRTKLKLTAIDNKLGVKEVKYSVDQGVFQKYDQPFYLPQVSGFHLIRFYSVDKLNNSTVGANNSGFEEFKHNVSKVFVDLTGPSLNHKIEGDIARRRDTMLLGPNNRIVLLATDDESGLKNITYSFDGQMAEEEYNRSIGVGKSGLHKLEFFGYDNVNNRNTSSFAYNADVEGPSIFYFFTVNPLDTKEKLDVYPSNVGLSIAGQDKLSGLKNISYSLDGEASKPYTSTIKGFSPNKKHGLVIVATDYLGNTTTQKVEFYTEK